MGLIPLPTDFGTGGIGTGAALTTEGYEWPGAPAVSRAGPDAAQAVTNSAELSPGARCARPGPAPPHWPGTSPCTRTTFTRPTAPAALVNFGSAAFPLLLGGVVAVCGLAALAHLLVSA